jgi:hypothetical protein
LLANRKLGIVEQDDPFPRRVELVEVVRVVETVSIKESLNRRAVVGGGQRRPVRPGWLLAAGME